MKRILGIVMAAGLVFGAAACDNKKEGTSTTTTTTTKPTDTKPADTKPADTKPADTKPADTTTTTTTTTTTAGGDVGVAECDEYIKKMTDCAGKMAPEAAGPMKESMETMKKAWKDASSTPEGKTALASGCKQALDAAKSAYASMGCSF